MTQPSLFDTAPPTPIDSDWTELEWTNGLRYRWRLHTDHFPDDDPPCELIEAPGSWRWELEIEREGEWREVRLFTRRDEIWAHVREQLT